MSEPITFKLEKPITVGTETYNELSLREPTTQDVIDLGLPYKLNPDLTSEPVPGIASKYVSRLAAIPPSAVKELDLVDFTLLLYAVVSFFNRSRQEEKAT